MTNLSKHLIEDIANVHSSIQENYNNNPEINELAEEIFATIAHSMIYEGYTARAFVGYLVSASEDEILEKYLNFDEKVLTESSISEEFIDEELSQLNEIVGALFRVGKAAIQGARYAKGVKGLAPIARAGEALKSAGTATSRIATQGPTASAIVRPALAKVKDTAKTLVSNLPQNVKNAGKAALKYLVPGGVGFAAGRMTAPKAESPATTKSAPESPSPSQLPSTQSPRTSSPTSKSKPSTVIKQTGDKEKDMKTWAQNFPELAKRVKPDGTQRGTGQSQMEKDAEDLRRMQKTSKERQGVKEQYDAYDLVLEYLLSDGHADTVEEANYVMMQLDSEYIKDIVENRGMAYSGGKPGPSGDGSRPGGIKGGTTYKMKGWDDNDTKKPKLKEV